MLLGCLSRKLPFFHGIVIQPKESFLWQDEIATGNNAMLNAVNEHFGSCVIPNCFPVWFGYE
jgi:hypothetical protein